MSKTSKQCRIERINRNVSLRACGDPRAQLTVDAYYKGRLDPVGSVIVEPERRDGQKVAAVTFSELEPGMRGKRIGTRLYEEAARAVCEIGMPFASDKSRSRFAEAFWEKQLAKGRARCVARHDEDDDAGYVYNLPWANEADKLEKRIKRAKTPKAKAILKKRLRDMDARLPYAEEAWGCAYYVLKGENVCKPEGVDLSAFDVKPKHLLWGAAALAVLGLATYGGGTAYVRRDYGWGELPRLDARTGTLLNRDPSKLLPSFAAKVDLLIRRMRAEGFDPIFWEGYRSPERAAEMERIGTGIRNSMHSYGVAADIVDRQKLWNNPAFFAALGRHAKALGLTWGGDWRKGDKPHIQGIPVAAQTAMRSAGSVAAREALARRYA